MEMPRKSAAELEVECLRLLAMDPHTRGIKRLVGRQAVTKTGTSRNQAGLSPLLIPIPFAVWHALAWASEILPGPPLTRSQVELMQIDTVSSPEMPGFIELGISPHSVEAILQKMLSNCG